LASEPQILVIAGPNGSGKSTITAALDIVGTYVNADNIKLKGNLSDLDAAREAERVREYCLEKRLSFTFETVFSTDRNLLLLKRAKSAGYRIEAVFVLTTDAAVNVFRVHSRVLEGGHDVPAAKISSRFAKSLANLPELVQLSDTCTVVDNTASDPVIIYRKDPVRELALESTHWTRQAILALVRPSSDF
jgi:predicted ABC-type ATPase